METPGKKVSFQFTEEMKGFATFGINNYEGRAIGWGKRTTLTSCFISRFGPMTCTAFWNRKSARP